MSATESVYTGFWTNWSEGQVKGSTLTLTSQHGAYLVAFLAVYVQLAGMNSWQILSYIFFRLKVSPEQTDDLKRQHLTILRNVSSDFAALWELAKSSWKGRKTKSRPFRQIFAILVTAAFHCVGFTIAGIFSSSVTSARSEVLLRSDVCGNWFPPAYRANQTGQSLADTLWEDKWDTVLGQAANFAARCYNTSAPSSNCNAYGRRLLSVMTSTHTKCPFDSDICTNGTVVRLDSGYVDSLLDLGINSHPSDRVAFRKLIECAPIKSDGYRKTFNPENLTQDAAELMTKIDSLQGHSFEAFYYGRNLAWDTEATYVLANYSFETSHGSFFVPYRLHSEAAMPAELDIDGVTKTFSPIPQLNRTDAEVVLMFLASQALYTSPVSDPWFDAQIPVPHASSEADGYDFNVYSPRQSVSVLGCTDHTQVCNPLLSGKNETCTSMPSHLWTNNLAGLSHRINLTPKQTSILRRFSDAIQNSIDSSFAENGDGGLLAGALTDDFTSAALPDNQWILELQNWFSIFLTLVQIRVSEYVAGFDNPQFNRYMFPPSSDDRWMCENQVVQRNDYASFSVLGLAVILCTGLLIMLLNISLSTIWPRLRDKSALDQYRNAQWTEMELLRLSGSKEKQVDIKVEHVQDSKTGLLSPTGFRSRMASCASSFTGDFAWSKKSMNGTDQRQPKDDRSDCDPATETIELGLPRDDFPPQELSRLMSREGR